MMVQQSMNTALKARMSDIPLLSHYLRHSYFAPEDSVFDPDARTFTLKLSRICYEQGDKGKALLFFSVVRYPRVAARLTITGIVDIEELWVDEQYNIRDHVLTLDEITRDERGRLLIVNEYLTVRLLISGWTELILQDVGHLNSTVPVTDYSREINLFPHMEAINQLREKV